MICVVLRLGRLLVLRRELVLRDVPADGLLVLFSEAAGIAALRGRIYWPAGLTQPMSSCTWLPCVVA